MLRIIAALSLLAGLSSAIVCLPEMCDSVKQPLLDCQGGVVKNGGFCGCTDVCAKIEGEDCQAEFMFGMIPSGQCDQGLHCVKQEHRAFGVGTCAQSHPDVDLGVIHHGVKREAGKVQTRCEQMRLSSMIIMVVYKGQWFPKCDTEGNFLPMQCDNTQHCFCVDKLMGTVQEGTKVLGAANC
ncbi:uncharacterized protein [Littorina saxatilis]|uniref:Thyroglobulin type-1 domain-containing protein n=1 Tax=Littorina saxatilis TaxID=31220 RepID=A0AAN9G944_9CAEN